MAGCLLNSAKTKIPRNIPLIRPLNIQNNDSLCLWSLIQISNLPLRGLFFLNRLRQRGLLLLLLFSFGLLLLRPRYGRENISRMEVRFFFKILLSQIIYVDQLPEGFNHQFLNDRVSKYFNIHVFEFSRVARWRRLWRRRWQGYFGLDSHYIRVSTKSGLYLDRTSESANPLFQNKSKHYHYWSVWTIFSVVLLTQIPKFWLICSGCWIRKSISLGAQKLSRQFFWFFAGSMQQQVFTLIINYFKFSKNQLLQLIWNYSIFISKLWIISIVNEVNRFQKYEGMHTFQTFE